MVSDRDIFSLSGALRETGFSASFITTFNAYLPFYEEVVLRRLLASGCTNNVVLMDAKQCAEALSQESTRPQRAGLDYTLIPVSSRGAFHPKILLRLGKRKGSLFVGSHNLTISGFGLNDELTNRFEFDGKGQKGLAPFVAVAELLRGFASQCSPEAVAALDAALEVARWIAQPHPVDRDLILLGTGADQPSLWDLIRSAITEPVQRILVVSPYFDSDLRFLQRITSDFPDADIAAAFDPETAEINASARHALAGVRFVNLSGRIPSQNRREQHDPRLHAKAILFEAAGATILVSGSANASGAAFLAPNGAYNAECVVLRRLGPEDDTLERLGLRAILDGPAVSITEWESISARTQGNDADESESQSHHSAALAVVDHEHLRIDSRQLEVGRMGRALDREGRDVGSVQVLESGPPTLLTVDARVIAEANVVYFDEPDQCLWLIVHRAARIAENFGSDVRRALRQAIGSLDEDPTQIEVLLKLSEKVIFDDEATLTLGATRPGRESESGDGESENPAPPGSLAIDVSKRKSGHKRRSIASGDITVLLDALIRSLGSGNGATTGPPGRSNEEEAAGSDDETDALPPEEPDRKRLAAAFRRKVQNLGKRLLAQFKANESTDQHRRSIVQTAAVLSIIRAIGTIERRQEWRTSGGLLHSEALEELFAQLCPATAINDAAIVPRVLSELGGERCEEVSIVVGLLLWLAWESGVDLEKAIPRDRRLGEVADPDQWPRLQRLAYLASHLVDDERAVEIASAALSDTPRRSRDGRAWLNTHLEFLQDFAFASTSPDQCEANGSPPQPGDLVLLPEIFDPRVRLVVNVGPGGQGATLAVVDEDNDSGIRKFLADRVPRLVPPVRLKALG